MKIRINRSLLVPLGFVGLLALLLLCLGIYFLVLDSVVKGRKFDLSKYQEISDSGTARRDWFGIKMHYEVFAKLIEENDTGDECFSLKVFDRVASVKDIVVCEEKKNIEFEGALFDGAKQVPMYMDIKYGLSLSKGWVVKKIALSLMEDEKAFKTYSLLSQQGVDLGGVRLQSEEEILSKGYYTSTFLDMGEGKYIGSVMFLDGVLKKIQREEGGVLLTFLVRIEDRILKISQRLDNVGFLDGDEIRTVNKSTINLLKEDSPYSVGYLYFPKDSQVEDIDLNSYCDNRPRELDLFCSEKKREDIDRYKIDIEEYLSDSIEELFVDDLMFYVLIPNAK